MAGWIGFARRGSRLLAVLTLSSSALLGTATWQIHNAIVFGNSSFTTIGTWNLVYVRAASVLHQATQQEIEDVYATLASRIENRLDTGAGDFTSERRHHHYTGDSRLQTIMTEEALGVFLRFPAHYLLTIPVGAYRKLIEVSGLPVWISLGWNVAILMTASLGLRYLMHQRGWAKATFLLIPCLYFVAGTLLVQTAMGDTRARVMVTPLLAIMAAQGIAYLINRRRAASAGP